MKQQDLVKHHHLDLPELRAVVNRLETELVEARLQISLGQESNFHTAKNLRRDLAQIKTIIRHKELTGQPATTQKPPAQKTKTAGTKKQTTKKTQKKASETKSKTKKEA
jgi:ribosomal protein L29